MASCRDLSHIQRRRRPGRRDPGTATKGSTDALHRTEPFSHKGCRETIRAAGTSAGTSAARRHRGAVAVAIAVMVTAAITATAGPAAAATAVGAGSYTSDPVGPLPSGCGTVSTSPRQFVTAHAPTGAIPTNEVVVVGLQKAELPVQREPRGAPRVLPAERERPRILPPLRNFLAPAPGLQDYHYPYWTSPPGSAG